MADSTYIKEAYQRVCKDTLKPESFWLTLYCSYPFYGGPEEGGWWGQDTVVKETKHFEFRDDAEKVKVLIDQEVSDLNIIAKSAYGKRCLHETEWLDARGLDDDYLPEPDGEEKYFVVIESERGEQEHYGDRYYS